MNCLAAETAPLLRYTKQNGGADLSSPHILLLAKQDMGA
jgi:hypothetical protein